MPTTDPTADNVALLHGEDDDKTGYRVPPHNFEAEMALLGAILTNNRAYDRVSEFLRPEHFADARHGRIYEVAGRLIDHGQIADPVTLKNYFEQDGDLNEIGGTQYLARLAASMVTIINAEDYGQTIFDRHLRRELINLGGDVVNRAYEVELETTAKQQIEIAEDGLYQLATHGHTEGGFVGFGEALTEAVKLAEIAYKRDSHVAGVSTGLRDLDTKLGGLHPSDLIILAGRPSMGKTALATTIAFNAARATRAAWMKKEGDDDDRNVVAFFSLEMSSEELATRLLSQEARVPSHQIRRGDIKDEDFINFATVSQELSRVPLFIDDTPALSVSTVRTRARRLKRQQKGLGLIVVDYLQLLGGSLNARPDNRVQEISDITRSLKALAKELEVPVVALSQLSRAVEQRDDKRPQLADLRESGSIEQDSDVVMFIYRDQYYHERAEPKRKDDEDEAKFQDRHARWIEHGEAIHGMAEVHIAKQRHGPIGKVELAFDPSLTRFGDLARDDHLPEDFG
jgi:replicative DNA helicase